MFSWVEIEPSPLTPLSPIPLNSPGVYGGLMWLVSDPGASRAPATGWYGASRTAAFQHPSKFLPAPSSGSPVL